MSQESEAPLPSALHPTAAVATERDGRAGAERYRGRAACGKGLARPNLKQTSSAGSDCEEVYPLGDVNVSHDILHEDRRPTDWKREGLRWREVLRSSFDEWLEGDPSLRHVIDQAPAKVHGSKSIASEQ